MNKKEKRFDEIVGLVQKKNSISIHELAKICHMSEITIRRDVTELERRGQIRNIRGVVLPKNEFGAYNLGEAGNENMPAKKSIGRYAALLILPEETVIIDSGTTTEQIAANIPYDAHITVLCFNVNVMLNLYKKPNVGLILAGGRYHTQTEMFESNEGLEIIRRTRANKVFVSAAGIRRDLGVTCASEYELASKRAILEAGIEKILVADSSKFGEMSPCYIGMVQNFDKIITDENLSSEWENWIRTQDVELVKVPIV